jgi:hypothetical protein
MTDAAPPKVPSHIRTYVDALGMDKAVELFLAFGGAPLYLGARPQERAHISSVLNPEQIRRLTKVIGRGHLRLPMPRAFIVQYLAYKDYTVNDIARKLHVTDVTVRNLLKGRCKRQIEMFPLP